MQRADAPACGFWLIVAGGEVETDSGLRVSGSTWAGSRCGDLACGDFRNSAGRGDGAGWRGGLRTKRKASPGPGRSFGH
jgi:hypothetical protein